MLPIFPLSQILAGLLAASLAFSGWQYVRIAGLKESLAVSGSALSGLATQLSVCEANTDGLIRGIEEQNQRIEQAAVKAAAKREAALAARDAALAALDASRKEYAGLRRAWPKDCVTAVSQARAELDL